MALGAERGWPPLVLKQFAPVLPLEFSKVIHFIIDFLKDIFICEKEHVCEQGEGRERIKRESPSRLSTEHRAQIMA